MAVLRSPPSRPNRLSCSWAVGRNACQPPLVLCGPRARNAQEASTPRRTGALGLAPGNQGNVFSVARTGGSTQGHACAFQKLGDAVLAQQLDLLRRPGGC